MAFRGEESGVAREIRVLAEVEKIWILYDLDQNGTLDFDEICNYLKEMAYPDLSLSDKDLKRLFDKIDVNGDMSVSKDEMGLFVDSLIGAQNDIRFKSEVGRRTFTNAKKE